VQTIYVVVVLHPAAVTIIIIFILISHSASVSVTA